MNGEISVALQQLARHQMITLLYRDILQDMAACEIEGWDKTEYISELQSLLNSFKLRSENHGEDKC